jgi:hypothetical protein
MMTKEKCLNCGNGVPNPVMMFCSLSCHQMYLKKGRKKK